MERILFHARKQGYAKYTSTLVEAWRVSIAGLIDAIVQAQSVYGDSLPEFIPEEDFEGDSITQFGMEEARLHRERGINLSMFLGLYKYYRYAFEDFVSTLDAHVSRKEFYRSFVERCFDRIEIAFCNQWSNLEGNRAIAELQEFNRFMTNEKNKYLNLFESIELPTFLVDEHGRLENLNVPASDLLGTKKLAGSMYYSMNSSRSQGRLLSDLLPWLSKPIDQLLKGDHAALSMEIKEFHEGDGRIFSILLSKMKDVSGKFHGGVVVLQDVTEQRRLERLREDVERITKHDLKIPLSGILTTLNCLMNDEMISGDQRHMLAMARESGYSMLGMINRSMDLYKMETGTYKFDPQWVDLHSVLDRVLDHVDGLAKGHGVKIVVGLSGAGGSSSQGLFVLAEEMLLYTALGNLLKNALEASPPNSTVRVNVLVNEGCHIVITNESGVPKQMRDTFFEKYSTWGKKSGTGLGTYSARLIVETMGGQISMDSDGSRTNITVKVPIAA